MINRETGLVEIYNRVKTARTDLGLTSFRRTPTEAIVQEDCPCVFMHEGVDTIIEVSSRSGLGYPAKRSLEVVLELVTSSDIDIRQLLLNLRAVVFSVDGSDPKIPNPIIGDNCFINENRTEGPNGYGLPDILGMSLVLDLIYTDNGF